jgi:hypothetical protein
VAILSGTLRAANAPLTADVQPLTLRPRTDAPMIVDIRLRSSHRTLLEGSLELEARAGNEILFRQQTQELTLAPGVSTHRLLLPPTPARSWGGLDVELRFLTRVGSIDLGRFPLSTESSAARHYVIAICSQAPALADDRPRLWQVLRPERFFRETNAASRVVASTPVWILPEDLPSAIGLCAFDVVVLEGPALGVLEERQLAQLAMWVEGGGSLCVKPEGRLGPEHLAFLNSLIGAPESRPAVLLAPGGKAFSPRGDFVYHRAGLGRLAIVFDTPASEAESLAPEWRRTTHFLAQARSPSRLLFQSASAAQRFSGQNNSMSSLAAVRERLMKLLPRSSRMIPLPVIASILAVFVLLVGPGEWLVLGRLRRRRWTWFTFPIIATGFTILTVRAAEHYLGREDHRAALVITDVDKHGRVLRENRLELWFAGRNGAAVSDLRQALAVPCLLDPARGNRGGITETPRYEGQLPARYTLRQALPQWTPYLQRTLSFQSRTKPPDFPWEAIDAKTMAMASDPARYVSERARAEAWTVRVYHSGTLKNALGKDDAWFKLQFLKTEALGWAASQSPSGQNDLVDLAMMDAEDEDQWLVVAERELGQELHWIRCLYRTDE